jgi:glycerol-3-phosphate dehydrogenase
LLRQENRRFNASRLTEKPAFGADFVSMETLSAEARHAASSILPVDGHEQVINALTRNHGSNYGAVLTIGQKNSAWTVPFGQHRVLPAEIIHAVHHEMALTLSDVVFRRTDLATTSTCDDSDLEKAAGFMAKAAGWSKERQAAEVAVVRQKFKEARTGRMSLCDRSSLAFETDRELPAEPVFSDRLRVRPV